MDDIWSEKSKYRLAKEFWLSALKQMRDAGFKRAFEKKKVKLPPPSGHELVDILNRFVKETGYVNAHAGLTSSDVIDNVRRHMIEDSMETIYIAQNRAWVALRDLRTRCGNIKSVGYTHWQVASEIEFKDRVAAWIMGLPSIGTPPLYKSVGGGTGNGRALDIIMGQRLYIVPFGDKFDQDGSYMQSGPFTYEYEIVTKLATIAAAVHKICLDIRFLCHTGELRIKRDKSHRGSSAMAGKNNPIEAEQMCGLTRLFRGYVDATWDCVAQDGLERTLDNSSTLRVVLQDSFSLMGYLLSTLTSLIEKVEIDEERCAKILKDNKYAANVEYEIAHAIKQGQSRLQAYEAFYKSRSRSPIWVRGER